ncbi:nuclear transport factor 2 family protein [Pleurocapsa sp. PCC 7319]|uniref:nuclear transport factor 2 family protein n=1 Tax=Pleurocapsa sp. PCC 7319 TaxID=118161 RepID=UPI00034D86D6|nr:nuclear transport factor 2 family protein [Pleurocapsa sp. PCC 7319]
MNQVLAFIVSLSIFLVFSAPMNSESAIQAMVERQATAWETQDISSLVRDFAPDAIFVAGGFTFNGVDAIRKAAEDYFQQFTDTKVKIKRIIVEDHQGAVEWDWSDRHKKTGQQSQAEDAIIFELQNDGKIIYWREYIEKKKKAKS